MKASPYGCSINKRGRCVANGGGGGGSVSEVWGWCGCIVRVILTQNIALGVLKCGVRCCKGEEEYVGVCIFFFFL